MSGNPCKITGCDLVVGSSGLRVRGDLFEYGNCWVFNAVIDEAGLPRWFSPSDENRPDPKFLVTHGDRWFERRGVFVVPKTVSGLSPQAEAYIAKYG